MIHREDIEWRDMWVTGAADESLPRALLVGDSMARSYFGQVEALLKGAYLCARLTSSTCVCDRVFDKELRLLLDDYRFAVIHFNNGLHGWGYDEGAYARGLRRVAALIAKRAPQSRLILANSTPMRCAGKIEELDPRTDRVRERNRLMGEIAAEFRLPVNDLFSLGLDHPEYFSEDGVHFNPSGQAALGSQVAKTIRAGTPA